MEKAEHNRNVVEISSRLGMMFQQYKSTTNDKNTGFKI